MCGIRKCSPPKIEDPLEDEKGGVLPPLEVQVLVRKHAVEAGLVKTGTAQSRLSQFTNVSLSKMWRKTYKHSTFPRHLLSNSYPPGFAAPKHLVEL